MSEITPSDQPVQLALFEPAEITRPDMNVGKWAGWLFASPWSKDLYEEKKFEWTTVLGNEKLKASLTVRPIKNRKRPTTTSYRIFLGLIQIWEQSGKPESGEFSFSARQLAHAAGWRWGGRDTTTRIQEQLSILSGTEIEWGRSFYRGDELETLIEDMRLIDGKAFLSRENSSKRHLFTSQHKVRLNRDLVRNMLSGKTKPVLSRVISTIKSDASVNLYCLLDNYLSKKDYWSRRSYGLILEDLDFSGERYNIRSKRHGKLKEFVEDLNGKEITTGTLNLFIEKTSDGEDYKLVARKIPKSSKKPRRFPHKNANEKEAIPYIVDDLMEGLSFVGFIKPSSRTLLEYYCIWYSRDMLFMALGLLKGDYRGNIKKSVIQAYSYILHRLAHERNADWVKECGKDCPYRPENMKKLYFNK